MSWLQLTIDVPRERVDSLESELETLGALSIALTDAADEPIIEPNPGQAPLWSTARVTALFEDAPSVGAELRGLATRWRESPEGPDGAKISRIEDRDWSESWREGLRPLRFGERLLVVPSCASPAQAETGPNGPAVLVIDPGLAFGSGTHPTTALCLSWLADISLEGRVVVDYGCGCGILGLAALRLGAARVIAVDHDPQAIGATRENLARNGLDPKRMWIGSPDELPELHSDVVMANIFSRVLIKLSKELTALLETNGQLAMSGILTSQCADVRAAFPEIEFDATRRRDDWALLVGHRRGRA